MEALAPLWEFIIPGVDLALLVLAHEAPAFMLCTRTYLLRPCTDSYQYSVSQTLWSIRCLIHSCSNNVIQCQNTQIVWTGNASPCNLSLLSAGKSSHRPRTTQLLIRIKIPSQVAHLPHLRCKSAPILWPVRSHGRLQSLLVTG
jgi:hypothetical protein